MGALFYLPTTDLMEGEPATRTDLSVATEGGGIGGRGIPFTIDENVL